MVLSFPLLTNYLWPAVFVFVVVVIVECSFLDTTMAAANNAKVHPAVLLAVFLPRHSRVGRLGHSGLITNHIREDGTLHFGCCSRVKRAAHSLVLWDRDRVGGGESGWWCPVFVMAWITHSGSLFAVT